MKELEVRIEDAVFLDLTEFYKFSLKKHPALDEATVLKKQICTNRPQRHTAYSLDT